MTAAGPSPYSGDILESPELVWCEDTWSEEREREARNIIQKKHRAANTFWKEKFEKEAKKNWDLFYKSHATNFYKDRHYLAVVFPELSPDARDLRVGAQEMQGLHIPRSKRKTLLELGCGVGNSVFPLLEENPGIFVYAYDFSDVAIRLLCQDPVYPYYEHRCSAKVFDATSGEIPKEILSNGGLDLCLLQFCLSAISPENFQKVASIVFSLLKPGGKLLLRDYGRYDEAQLRFGKNSLIENNFYARGDGTRSYFFTSQELKHIFCHEQGFIELENSYIRRQYANRAQQKARHRIWVHAKFQKPFNT